MDASEEKLRYFQGLLFAQDKRNGNPDSNFYAFPLPLIPIMDWAKKEIVKVLELATGGKGDSFTARTTNTNIIDHCKGSEYAPELLPEGTRQDLKPLHVVQPDGPSFTVSDDNLIEWQNWRMRLSFNTREGAVLHDITYQGRSVLHRLSMSEMVRGHSCNQNVMELTFLDCPLCRPQRTLSSKAGFRLRRWRRR